MERNSSGMLNTSPTITVITPTFNRSKTLYYTIAALQRSTYQDWEHVIIGDGCTDDTEKVVNSFGDPRLRFTNLKENSGYESTPNNEGFNHARGRYIAYLHQDDLWFPFHLETALEGIDRLEADIVFTLGISLDLNGNHSLCGAVPDCRYIPNIAVPSSLRLLRREVIEELGPWRLHSESVLEPGQEFLIRCWKAGKRIRSIPVLTTIKVPAGRRPGIYSVEDSDENRLVFERMQNESQFLVTELTKVAFGLKNETTNIELWPYFRRGFFNLVKSIGQKLGITPLELAAWIRFRRKGAVIEQWRQKCGLTKEYDLKIK